MIPKMACGAQLASGGHEPDGEELGLERCCRQQARQEWALLQEARAQAKGCCFPPLLDRAPRLESMSGQAAGLQAVQVRQVQGSVLPAEAWPEALLL